MRPGWEEEEAATTDADEAAPGMKLTGSRGWTRGRRRRGAEEEEVAAEEEKSGGLARGAAESRGAEG